MKAISSNCYYSLLYALVSVIYIISHQPFLSIIPYFSSIDAGKRKNLYFCQLKSELVFWEPEGKFRMWHPTMQSFFIMHNTSALHYYNPTMTSPNHEPATAALHAMQGMRQHQPNPLQQAATEGDLPKRCVWHKPKPKLHMINNK